MEKKLSFFIIFIINLIQYHQITAQSNQCSSVNSPKAYSDCGIYSNIATSTICCLIRGVYGGNNGTACIPVDILFANKSVTLTTGTSTGTMICGANASSSNFIILNKVLIFLFILIIIAWYKIRAFTGLFFLII